MNSNFFSIKTDYLEVEFCSIGASVYRIIFDNNEMLLTPKDKKEFIKSPEYFGKTLGRVAGRIKCNSYGMNLDNTHYDYCLHGGFENLSYKAFDYKIFERSGSYKVVFSYDSKDGECGFIGNVKIEVTYIISKSKAKIDIEYRAVSDNDTILNLSNHMYFNFGTKNLLDYRLYIPSSQYLKMDEHQLPYEIEKIPEYLDFSKSKKIKNNIDCICDNFPNTIDHTFVLDKNYGFKTGLILQNDKYKLTCKTSYECMNCYLNCFESNIKFTNENVEKDFKGLAVEPVHSNISNIIKLEKGKTYYEKSSYIFERKQK